MLTPASRLDLTVSAPARSSRGRAILGRLLQYELVRFGLAGGLNTTLGFLLYVGSLRVGVPYLLANVGAWCVGVIVAFILQAHLVFRAAPSLKTFRRFVTLNLSNLAFSTVMLAVLVKRLGFGPIGAALITTVLIVIGGYLCGKIFIFTATKR